MSHMLAAYTKWCVLNEEGTMAEPMTEPTHEGDEYYSVVVVDMFGVSKP